MILTMRRKVSNSVCFFLLLATVVTLIFYYESLLPIRTTIESRINELTTNKNKRTLYSNFPKWVILKNNGRLGQHSIEELAKALQGWRILVVKIPGKREINTTCRLANCLTFTTDYQRKWSLPGDTHPLNAAFRFVIEHGSRVIYETDGLRPAHDLLQLQTNSSPVSILAFRDSNKVFNHYAHFGLPALYPRGVPVQILDKAYLNSPNKYMILENWTPPAIQHVVNLDPCQHPIQCSQSMSGRQENDNRNDRHQQQHNRPQERQQQMQQQLPQQSTPEQLQQPHQQEILKLDVPIACSAHIFDTSAPPVLILQGTLSIFKDKNTIYTHNSLWALIQFRTTCPDLQDIWRGLFVQRLLWEIDETIGFYSPSSKCAGRRTHIKERTWCAQKDTSVHNTSLHHNHNTEKLIKVLTGWYCPEDKRFLQCIFKLSLYLFKTGFWTRDDVSLTKAWISFLKGHGYDAPRRVIRKDIPNTTGKGRVNIEASKRLQDRFINYTRVHYVASRNHCRGPNRVPVNNVETYNVANHIQDLRIKKLCSKLFQTKKIQLRRLSRVNKNLNSRGNRLKQFFLDILVIIVFNTPHYDNLEHLLGIFGSQVFTNIVICGYDLQAFLDQTKNMSLSLTFVEVFHVKGHFGYQCATKVMQMGYKSRGYFFTGDDVIHFWWHSSLNLDKNKIWMNQMHILDPDLKQTWTWWNRTSGAYNRVIHNIKTTPTPNNDNTLTPHDTFLRNLFNNTRGTGVVRGISDTYYIPSLYKNDVIYYFNKFYEERTFLEVAIPVVLWGIEMHENMYIFNATNLKDSARNELDRFYHKAEKDDTMFTFHPVKLSSEKNKNFFCNIYFVKLLTKMGETL